MNLESLFKFWKNNRQSENKELSTESSTGVIGEYFENDLPVIVKFDSKIPHPSIRSTLPFLTVITWKYNGNENNGMPNNEVNSKMILLESAIQDYVIDNSQFMHAYSRTGNNLKELIYYSCSQEDFMKGLNKALAKHEKYPIEINFYEDTEWEELEKLINDVTGTSGS